MLASPSANIKTRIRTPLSSHTPARQTTGQRRYSKRQAHEHITSWASATRHLSRSPKGKRAVRASVEPVLQQTQHESPAVLIMQKSGKQQTKATASKRRHEDPGSSSKTTPDRGPAAKRASLQAPHQRASPITGIMTNGSNNKIGTAIFNGAAASLTDDVEEYAFTSDDHADAEHDIPDDQSHISVSSDDAALSAQPYAMDQRPWLLMNDHQRLIYEQMFVTVTSPAVGQSWSYTELYQAQMDGILLNYMKDFPLPTWQIGKEAAEKAYNSFRERVRWRQLGIKIYGSEQMPNLYQARQFMAAQQGAPPPPQGMTTVSAPPVGPVRIEPATLHQHTGIRQMTYIAASGPSQKKVKTAHVASPSMVRLLTAPKVKRRSLMVKLKYTAGTKQSGSHLSAGDTSRDWNANHTATIGPLWEDGIYEQKTLDTMEEVRQLNAAAIASLEMRDQTKKNALEDNGTLAGYYAFATVQDEQKSRALGALNPGQIIMLTQNAVVTIDEVSDINLCWFSARRSRTVDISQVSFSVKDLHLTRQQIDICGAYTKLVAARIIDFTPNALQGETLKRVQAESGLSNKELRDRYFLNGSYTDTVTPDEHALSNQQDPVVDQTDKKPSSASLSQDCEIEEENAAKTGNEVVDKKKATKKATKKKKKLKDWEKVLFTDDFGA